MPDDDLSRCVECGASLAAAGPFCLHCGASTGAPSTSPPVVADAAVTPPPFAVPSGPSASGPSPLTPPARLPSAVTPTPHRHSGPLSEPVVPLPATAQTQPVSAGDLGDIPTASGEGPLATPVPYSEEGSTDYQPGDRVLQQYRIVRKLGHGGMGAVYLARDDLTGQQVAVKALPAALAREKGIRERFTLEARALAALDHPNIVPLINYAQDGDDRFLIMKYVEGTPLDELIEQRGKLPCDLAQRVFAALVGALGYAHERGVIHRDVKPANVLMAKDGRIYLVDFGIAKKQESVKLTQTGMLMGTPQYMSPEQISGHPIDGRNDLYGAGLILFEMLTGRPPFVGDRTFTVLRAHVESPVPDPVELRGEPIPSALLNVIDRLLQKKPDDRPDDATAALALLDDISAPAPHFGPSSEETAGVTAPLAAPAALAASFEDEYTAAFGRQRGLAMTAFAVGAVALCATAIVVVTAFPEWIRPAESAAQKDHPVERAQTDAFVAAAKTRLEEGKPRAALTILEGVPKVMMNRVDVVSLEADAFLALRDTTRAAPLVQSLLGNQAVLPPELKLHLDKQKARLDELDKQRTAADRAEATRVSALPKELTNEEILDVTHGQRSSQQLQECWEHTVLKYDPKAKGMVRLKARIRRDGSVGTVQVTKQTVGDDRFAQCIKKVADRWRFPEVRGPPVDVVQTFSFVPQ